RQYQDAVFFVPAPSFSVLYDDGLPASFRFLRPKGIRPTGLQFADPSGDFRGVPGSRSKAIKADPPRFVPEARFRQMARPATSPGLAEVVDVLHALHFKDVHLNHAGSTARGRIVHGP